MADWTLNDKGGEVYILHEEPLSLVNDTKKIISNAKIDFRKLLKIKRDRKPIFDESVGKEVITPIKVMEKHIGYCLKYKYDKPYPKFDISNSFGIFYQEKYNKPPKWETLFEDKVVRLCGYRHANGAMDYLLFCRSKWERTNYLDQSIWLTMKCLLNMSN